MAAPRRSGNPAEGVKFYTDQINAAREKLEEALADIAEYAEKLAQLTADTRQRLLTRD